MANVRRRSIEFLPWDSDFFKRNIARLRLSLVNEQQMRSALTACKKADIECLYATLGSAQCNISLAEEHGFSLVGTRVTYEREAAPERKSNTSAVKIRLAVEKDTRQLVSLSRALSRESRFARDPRFGPAAAQRLYRAWTEKLLLDTSPTTQVLVATVSEKCAGFVAACVKNGIVHIELVIVDKKFRGKGVGSALMASCMAQYQKRGFKKFHVVTQGSNIAAQRLYQSCGFKLTAMVLDYHKWFTHDH